MAKNEKKRSLWVVSNGGFYTKGKVEKSEEKLEIVAGEDDGNEGVSKTVGGGGDAMKVAMAVPEAIKRSKSPVFKDLVAENCYTVFDGRRKPESVAAGSESESEEAKMEEFGGKEKLKTREKQGGAWSVDFATRKFRRTKLEGYRKGKEEYLGLLLQKKKGTSVVFDPDVNVTYNVIRR
ncbi:unnamed protein product [Amaranthus hypochondriacus]